MKKVFLLAGYCLLGSICFAQTITVKLQKAFQQFEADSQLKHAISSLYVIDAATGNVVFDKNSQIGLAPASTQKIITSVTAFELLGKDYKYKTELFLPPGDNILFPVGIKGFGDPTFGSGRYANTKPEIILSQFLTKLRDHKLVGKPGMFYIDNSAFETRATPDGWIMQDVGNYYGAGAEGLNWRENQYDLALKSPDRIGGNVSIASVNGTSKYPMHFISEVKTAAKGTGDNAYIYLPLNGSDFIVRGTIPAGENNFVISGAVNEAVPYFVTDIGIYIHAQTKGIGDEPRNVYAIKKMEAGTKIIYTHYSPSLDSIIYWFNKKSINLYGEALIKTFAYEKHGFGSTDSGVAILKKFWKEKGLDEDELNMADGSGLSPLNRVTTHAQVEILKYAKTKDWFPYFYDALPEYNAMKMKSGTISDVKGFCGYHKAKDGKEYIFSFLVNNYNGKSSQLVSKMYKVLDELK